MTHRSKRTPEPLAVQLNWSHQYPAAVAAMGADKVGCAPMIAGSAGIGATTGPWYECVMAKSKNKDMALKYAAYMYDHNADYMSLMLIYPILKMIVDSLCEIEITGERTFVGLANYIKAFSAGGFGRQLWHTLLYIVIACTVETVMGFLFALFFEMEYKGSSVVRSMLMCLAGLQGLDTSMIEASKIDGTNLIQQTLGGAGYPRDNRSSQRLSPCCLLPFRCA